MDDKPLRIAMFTDNYYPFVGGVPNSIEKLSKGLRAKGHSVTVFCPKYPEQTEPDTDPDIVRCKLLRYHKTKVYNFPLINIFSSSIRKEFLRRGFDVVHSHHPFWMGKKGHKLARKYGLPSVYTQHTMYDQYSHYLPLLKGLFKKYIAHGIIRKFSQSCDAVFSPVGTSKTYLTSMGVTKPISVMATGVDMVPRGAGDVFRERYKPEQGVLLCSVARLAPEKNFHFMLKAIKRVTELTPARFRCLIVGGGPDRASLDDAIIALGLSGVVTMIGEVPQPEVGRYLEASDFFVFASTSEVQGTVLYEAMAARCGAVSVYCSGADDVIIDGFNGYRTHEDIEEWAARVASLLNDPGEMRRLSDNAYEHAKQYSVEAMAEQAERTYRSVIGKRSG
ncbi:MAG: glycosyltransferase [Oscillospiraceae bacterium]|jgi:glycosyltransferase involved in cell wall biosynthesis|nr:glycosyltransferase [Oscillospiraceae bacterium]